MTAPVVTHNVVYLILSKAYHRHLNILLMLILYQSSYAESRKTTRREINRKMPNHWAGPRQKIKTG
ncbi:hypothetical protein BDV35DRAFT_346214 [Aspergillus flavus]|uniref:Uncharacterized protein n=1 Tax=Aspergillus flavus TaxID=5059 RepID=A0A5N6H6M6_ASPFL|nr:hypothetical protein BDV35DRAFT_346214 [Aspergillus flavus]